MSTAATAQSLRGAWWANRPGRLVRAGIGTGIFILAVELFTRAELVNPAYLPRLSDVLTESVMLLGDPSFRADLWATVLAWAGGLSLTVLFAVPVGVILGSSALVYRVSWAIIEVMRPIPPVVLIPLAILLYGSGTQMKLVLVVFAACWPILLNTIYGVHGVDKVARETARSFGFPRVAIVGLVVVPSAAPFIMAGVRIAASVALILVITAELIGGGSDGLGVFMAVASANSQSLQMYASAIIAGVLGLVVNLLIAALERRLFHWQPGLREA